MARAIGYWFGGVLGLLVCLEVVFRVLPVSTSTNTGYYTDPMILNYPAGHRWTVATGWDLRNAQRLTANNYGYVAHRDFEYNPNAVALIGDSFVEASMLDAEDRPGVQLERALGSRPVYAMGAPGTALLDYAERIRFASEKFGVRDFVVLMERGDVLQSLCGSGNINGPCLDPATLAPRLNQIAPPSFAKRILRHSALAQYFASQLKLQTSALVARLSTALPLPKMRHASDRQLSATESTKLTAVTRVFVERIKPYVAGRIIIILDCDRAALMAGKPQPDPARRQFIEMVRSAGALVVDTEPLFTTHLQQSPLDLNVGPYDHHLNKLGIEIAMRAAAIDLLPQRQK